MVEVGQEVQEGEPLIIFSDTAEEEDAAAILKSLTKGNEILSDIGRKKVHAKVSGIVQDIKVYRTVEMNKLSDTLQHICKKYEAKVNKLKKVMRDYKIDKEYELEPSYKLPQEGKLKNLEGCRIEVYIKTVDKLASGDKIVYLSGLKGVVSTLIPKGEEATSEYRPNEFVSAFLTSTGVFGRMVSSCMTNGLINKGLIELARSCQSELGIKWRPIQDILMDGIEDEDKK
jgi:DNA polymerase II small subunit/DNA polymerase delta subunit B